MLSSTTRFLRRALAALVLLAATPAAAEPALWAIKDADSTIYIFGTVHALKPDVAWRSEKVTKALAESKELVIEVVGADDPAVMQPLIVKYGLDPSAPLSRKISAQDKARLTKALAEMGAPPEAVEPMRPWLAAITVALQPILKAGYDPTKGAEAILTAEAKAAGKVVGSLETPEQQLRFFADLPTTVEVALLKSTLDDVDEGPALLDQMVASWTAGDQKGLEEAFVGDMRREYPELYAALIAGRNAVWARQLKQKLAGSGVSFVAVGAGHLVGPESVQAELAKLGVKAERR
ncbi:TraB/GumN family protein [Phenylobacterium sp.]|jgi:uncharacterized protein YbaP (TraB family)|uniref:TraB/GumN family protein n=1 Tax=Phenylobacterium sp. TaxID=1871053 RepID=UPI002F956935